MINEGVTITYTQEVDAYQKPMQVQFSCNKHLILHLLRIFQKEFVLLLIDTNLFIEEMEENIKISIVTPSYNQGPFIESAILSVLNQSYKNIEYIVVDGGSTDNTMDIVNKYKDKIDIIISEKDKGQSDAINKGFKLATGKLLGWINSDDVLYPDCVEKIVELYHEKPDGSIYYPSNLDFIDKDGKWLRTKQQRIPDKNYLLNIHYDVIQQGSFYEVNQLKKIGYIDESIYYCMDLDLWLRLLDEGKIYYYDDHSLSAFRIWEETKTSLGGKYFLQDTRQTINKHGAKRFSRTKFHLGYVRSRIMAGEIKRFFRKKIK
jgi:glycosyltransferase involved in cell wall biosynthesis